MTTKKRTLKVFLCHAHADAKLVHVLYNRLTRYSLDVWLDKVKLLPGQVREREIRKAVSESDLVFVCHSKQFNEEGFHHKEVKIALSKADSLPEGTVFIIPALLEKCEVLENLKSLDSVNLFEDLPLDTFEDGYERLLRLLRSRANDVGAILRIKRSRLPKVSSLQLRDERFVPEDVLRYWLIRHDIAVNPFGCNDLKSSYQLCPVGAARPDEWERILNQGPLFSHCPTAEDAEALAYLLRKECLPLENINSIEMVSRHVFPVWAWIQQATPVQSPLLTLAHSAARTWLGTLPTQPRSLLNLPLASQNALLELLYWSMGSKKALVNLIQLNGLSEDENTLKLIRKISEFESEFSLMHMPQDAILLSWLKIRPLGMEQTYLILPGDDLLPVTPAQWFKEFGLLIPILFVNGIVTKMFASSLLSSSLSSSLSLQQVELFWSEKQLSRSLEGQFDASMHPKEISMGKSTRFHELFGPGVTEEETTRKLISASHHSLARMLMLGNRLFQEHCKKDVSEKYLSPEELDDILNVV